MKALFAHSLKFYIDDNKNLYLRGYDEKYWQRYLKHFDTLYVIGRIEKLKSQNFSGLNLFEGKGLVFVEVPDIHKIKGFLKNNKKFDMIAKKLIEEVDLTIARVPGIYSSKIVKLLKKINKPYLIEMVGCPWDSLWNHSFKGKIVAPFVTHSTKKLLIDAPYVIYVTSNFLQTRYPTKGKNINCSNVALQKSNIDVLNKRISKIDNSNESIIRLGTTAAVDVRYKGQERVIKALAKLDDNGMKNIVYQLVGGGNTRYLRKIAEKFNVSDKVEFLGSKNHNDVFSWLDEIDIYVQPSKQEGLPRALIEAMSRGLPCLGASTGGIPELITNEFIFPNGKNSVNEIVKIITKFNKNTMKSQAKRNFVESKKYDEKLIDDKRTMFIEMIIKKEIV